MDKIHQVHNMKFTLEVDHDGMHHTYTGVADKAEFFVDRSLPVTHLTNSDKISISLQHLQQYRLISKALAPSRVKRSAEVLMFENAENVVPRLATPAEINRAAKEAGVDENTSVKVVTTRNFEKRVDEVWAVFEWEETK